MAQLVRQNPETHVRFSVGYWYFQQTRWSSNLPNKHLIEMQWHLNRVVALSGAAEAADLDDDTDEEGGGPMVS